MTHYYSQCHTHSFGIPWKNDLQAGHGHKAKSAQASESRVATEKLIGRETAAAEIAM